MKFPIGATVMFNGVSGTVVENYKLPCDICIDWETGQKASYDEDFLIEHKCVVVKTNKDK